MTSAPAIGFDYVPSRWLRRLLLLIAALTVLAIMLCALPWWLRLVLAIAVVLATWLARRRMAASRVAAAGWSDGREWTLRMIDHEDVPASLVSFRVLGACVLLRLRTADDMQVLLLAPDNSDADIRRRLRMRLAAVQPGEALPRV
ncbi:MAG TPA: protein YgfX [Rhodanobacter sp.]|nr:protein YgfX [Rhodanobacter sp.]